MGFEGAVQEWIKHAVVLGFVGYIGLWFWSAVTKKTMAECIRSFKDWMFGGDDDE